MLISENRDIKTSLVRNDTVKQGHHMGGNGIKININRGCGD